jgi:hypothetical protein
MGMGVLDSWNPVIALIEAVRVVPAAISGAVGAAGLATAGRNRMRLTPLRKNLAMLDHAP